MSSPVKKVWRKNWFSNMLPFDEALVYQGVKYYAVENFYQAMKLPKDRIDLRTLIAAASPHKSKTLIRNRKIFAWRDDWNEQESLKVMEFALRHKFRGGTSWALKLAETGSEIIIEWNNWGDTFWGRDLDSGIGQNQLGVLLMKIREELKSYE